MNQTDPFPSAPPNAPRSPSDRPPSSAPPARSMSVPPDLHAGLRISGKYELLRKLGTGAMGEVWAAKHLTLDEEVAIKLVMRDTIHEDGTTAESRFLLEARVAATLSRKTRHIVAVTDHGEDGPYAYLVMELLHGESLDGRLARTGPLSLEKAVPIIYQIARALSVAHADGIVHRDLKPSNVFVTVDEEGRSVVKILDFGIAKLRASRRKIPTDAAKHTTMRGFLLGTPAYMSPEQARGKAIDHRTDVWALAVMAYHLLTREYPFDGETPEDLFARLCRVEPISIRERRPDLPQVVVDFFARAFAQRLDERFQTAVALSGAFEQLEPLARGARVSIPPAMNAISVPPPSGGRAEPKVAISTLPGIAGVPAPPAAETRGEQEEKEREEEAAFESPAPRSSRPPSGRPSTPLGGLRPPNAPSASAAPLRSAPSTPPSGRPPPSAAAKEESSIFVAGLPSKKNRWKPLFAAGLVLGVLLATGTVLNIYFERDTKGTGMVAGGATNVAPPSTTTTAREVIPPPEPAVAANEPVVNANDLPGAPPVLRQASKTVVSPSNFSASIVPEAAPVVAPPTPAAAAAAPATTPKKPVDKGEIF